MIVVVALLTAVGGSLVAHSQYAWLSQTAGRINQAVAAADEAAAEQPTEYGQFHEIQNMIVNPAQTDGNRYLMVNVGLESDKAEVISELEEKEIVVRDRLLRLLSQYTVPQLSDIDLRPALKDTLRTAVNGVLRHGEVQRLYFTQYVLQ